MTAAHQLMVIVGHSARGTAELGAYTIQKKKLTALDTKIELALAVRGGITTPPPVAALDRDYWTVTLRRRFTRGCIPPWHLACSRRPEAAR